MLPIRSTVKSWKSAMDCDISGLIRVACEASPVIPTLNASEALAPKSCIAAPADTAFSRMASSAPTTAESSSTPPSCSPISPVKSPVDSSVIAPLSRSFTVSIWPVTEASIPGAAANAPPRMVSPTRPSAAPTLSIAPENVCPAFSAEPPRVVSIARWRSSKLILPWDARLVTSSAEMPSSLESAETAGMPLSPSCARVSPITFPAFLALVKIEATSPKPLPAKLAVSATVPSTSASSLPGLMPAARNIAEASAASEVAKAVPFTAEPMSSMTCADSAAESLRPLNLACAWSMASSLEKPLDRAVASTPPAAAPADRAPTLSVLAMPLESFVPSFSPDLATVFSALPSAAFTPGAILSVVGIIDRNPTPISVPAAAMGAS